MLKRKTPSSCSYFWFQFVLFWKDTVSDSILRSAADVYFYYDSKSDEKKRGDKRRKEASEETR